MQLTTSSIERISGRRFTLACHDACSDGYTRLSGALDGYHLFGRSALNGTRLICGSVNDEAMDDRPEPVRFSELPAGEADLAAPAMPVAAEYPDSIKQAWQRIRRVALGEPLPTGRYAAFISYRQLEPDRAFAISLHRALETYVVPKGLGGGRHLGRVFRDADELAASSDLGSTIREALDRSDWLIVVCSPRSRASRWVDAEIRHFADHGRSERILAVLIEGEPSQSFPAALLTLKRVTHGPNLVVDADPLAADARPDPSINHRQRLRGALLSLAAPMLGVTLDALVRRDHVRAVRRLTAIVAVTVSVLCILAISLYLAETSRRDARARQLEALERESLLLANLARQQTAAGDAVTGALLALRGLPSRPGDRPIVGEAVGALIEALAQRREGAILKINASRAVPSPDSQAFIVFANPGESQLWEPSTGRTFPLMHERPVDAAAFAPDGSRLVTGDWNGNAKVWSRQGEVIRTFRPHTDGFVLLDFSANGQELFSVSQDGTARKTTLDGDSTVLNTGNSQRPFRSAAFHRASATLAAGTDDGKVFIRAGNGLHRVLEPSASDYEPALAFDHQARHLLVRWPKSGTVVFDIASERRTAVAVGPDASAGAISPDGGIVVAGKRNGAVSAWSAATGQLIADLPGHAAEVTDIRF
nr:TIR domain-containing protein [Methylobacterium sp. L1A1]